MSSFVLMKIAPDITKGLKLSATKEVGGIMLSRGDEIVKLVPLPNKSKTDLEYRLPNGLAVLWKIKWDLLRGLKLIGEWHTHIRGIAYPSMADDKLLQRKADVAGEYKLGIISVRDKELRIWKRVCSFK